jgi:hypothetical protein
MKKKLFYSGKEKPMWSYESIYRGASQNLRACLGLLCSSFFGYAPPNLLCNSSTVELLKQVM